MEANIIIYPVHKQHTNIIPPKTTFYSHSIHTHNYKYYRIIRRKIVEIKEKDGENDSIVCSWHIRVVSFASYSSRCFAMWIWQKHTFLRATSDKYGSTNDIMYINIYYNSWNCCWNGRNCDSSCCCHSEIVLCLPVAVIQFTIRTPYTSYKLVKCTHTFPNSPVECVCVCHQSYVCEPHTVRGW